MDANAGKVIKMKKIARMHFERLETRREALHVSAFKNPKSNGTHEVKTTVDELTAENLKNTPITKFRIESETGLRTIKFRLL
jgi:hypothetical protein